MKRTLTIISLALFLLVSVSCNKKDPEGIDKMEWWRDARFGLFIHWGIYSIPAGEWQGKLISGGDAACIRDAAQIPLNTYDSLVSNFNPSGFNADEWVKLAKSAGMRYIVVTSKHHDGFCMFDSKETDYDVMSTPFKRDILKELSEACTKHGMVFCIYYSIMDWHHPDYLPRRSWENERSAEMANYDRYILYVKNQIKELLTNYGKVGVLWFDGEWENSWNIERAKDVYGFTRDLQPGIILKTGHGINYQGHLGTIKMESDSCYFSDFGTPSRKSVPNTGIPLTDWENILVMNKNWGYNKSDQNWKSSEELVRILIENASKGGNFLLNVGPSAEGLFPDSSIVKLNQLGSWMEENGESIYGTGASPFDELYWGRCTQKETGENTILYLHVFDWPGNGNLIVPGLDNKIIRAYALKDKKHRKLSVRKTENGVEIDVKEISVSKYATVIALEIKGRPVIAKNSN